MHHSTLGSTALNQREEDTPWRAPPSSSSSRFTVHGSRFSAHGSRLSVSDSSCGGRPWVVTSWRAPPPDRVFTVHGSRCRNYCFRRRASGAGGLAQKSPLEGAPLLLVKPTIQDLRLPVRGAVLVFTLHGSHFTIHGSCFAVFGFQISVLDSSLECDTPWRLLPSSASSSAAPARRARSPGSPRFTLWLEGGVHSVVGGWGSTRGLWLRVSGVALAAPAAPVHSAFSGCN